ncbi:MAG: HAMP domain-containing protein [Deltaproteobacteria bacterium]|nr:HAMP domain-containing protein [Deltaproteobacteria bacterium]
MSEAAKDTDNEQSGVTGRRSLLSRLYNGITSLGVRYKIAGSFIVILSLAIASLAVVTFSRQKEVLQHELRNRAEILARQLAIVGKDGLLTKQELPVLSTIMDIQKGEDVVYAMIIDDKGRVFAHSELSKKGSLPADEADRLASQADDLFVQETVLKDAAVLDAAFPIILKAKKIKIGVARIGLSQRALNEAIYRQKISFLWIGAAFVAAGFLISYAIAGIITKPIDSLVNAIQTVADGNLSVQAPIHYQDEIGKLTGVFNQMILSLREKFHMEKYLSGATVQNIKKNRDLSSMNLGGERKYITALFSDVRGFTSMSEKMGPEQVVGLLNIYLNLQATVIRQRGGSIDKFVGDEVMAIFEGRGNEVNAVRAALDIQRYCKAMNTIRSEAGELQMFVGIGLNSGEAVCGNMGSEDYMDYTVIGDNINIAARLCNLAQPGQVLISKAIADEIADCATWKELSPVTVKGKDRQMPIYEVAGIKGVDRQYLRRMTDAPMSYRIEGLSNEYRTAVVKNISPSGCLVEASSHVGVGSILIMEMNHHALGGFNARAVVKHVREHDSTSYIGIYFEDMREETKQRITHWIYGVESKIAEGPSA